MNNDLISREAAIEAIKSYCMDCNNYNGSRCRACNFDDAMIAIDDIPAVDAESVRHGRWEHGMQCPFCRQIDITQPNYCPNCGAKMDGKDGDNGV